MVYKIENQIYQVKVSYGIIWYNRVKSLYDIWYMYDTGWWLTYPSEK